MFTPNKSNLSFSLSLVFIFFNFTTATADVSPTRGGNGVSIPHAPHSTAYDYSPSMMQEADGRFRLWWCGNREETALSPFVDTIYHSQAQSPQGPWSAPQKVFSPTGSTHYFDRDGTCDPSVIKVKGTYYMYYSGFRDQDDPSVQNIQPTQIGVASSSDGITWTRLNAGNPIIAPRQIGLPPAPPSIEYGAGQPSAVYLDGWYFLLFSDTTGDPGVWGGYGHIYVMRSRSPLFPADPAQTQEWRANSGTGSFLPYNSSVHASFPLYFYINVNWSYHGGLDQFILTPSGSAGIPRTMGVGFFGYPGYNHLTDEFVIGNWAESHDVARTPWGHFRQPMAFGSHGMQPLNYLQSNCVLPLDIMRAVYPGGNPDAIGDWEMGFAGLDYTKSTPCGNIVRRAVYDYDGDRIADPIIYRAGGAAFWRNASADGQLIHSLGSSTSIPLQADYDGDGIADYAVARPSGSVSGYLDWTWVSSDTQLLYNQPTWGLNSDRIAVADYDGDGRDDYGVFRESNGTWYVLKTSGGSIVQSWGAAGDIAVPADYDGDGKDDIAVFRPSTAQWMILKSSGGTTTTVFSDGYCRPVVGDYDNDGRTDLACWRWKNTKFYALLSSNGAIESYTWGLKGDFVAVGDFSGDGTLDFNVWRPTNGTWYSYIRGAGETTSQQWGLPSDKIPRRIENQF